MINRVRLVWLERGLRWQASFFVIFYHKIKVPKPPGIVYLILRYAQNLNH